MQYLLNEAEFQALRGNNPNTERLITILEFIRSNSALTSLGKASQYNEFIIELVNSDIPSLDLVLTKWEKLLFPR